MITELRKSGIVKYYKVSDCGSKKDKKPFKGMAVFQVSPQTKISITSEANGPREAMEMLNNEINRISTKYKMV